MTPTDGDTVVGVEWSALGRTSGEGSDGVIKQARVRIRSGADFGTAGGCFMRINSAATPQMVRDGVQRITQYLRTLR